MSMSVRLCVMLVLACVCVSVSAKPTIYAKNEHDKLEPVLVAVSSTVIPLPVYKVGYGVTSVQGPKPPRPPGEHKLITAASKKKKAGETIKILQHKEDEKKEFL